MELMKDFKEQLCAFYVYRLPYLQCLLCFCLCLFVSCENYEKWPVTLSGLEDEISQNWRNSTGNLENEYKEPRNSQKSGVQHWTFHK